MWRKIDNIPILIRSQRVPGWDPARVAPAVVHGSPCYIVFDPWEPEKVIASFKDKPATNEEIIITAARERLYRCKWEKVRGLNGATWHVCYSTMPLNRRNLFNVRLAACATDTGKPGIALYDLEGIILFLARYDACLEIRADKRKSLKQLYELLMQLYYLDWSYDDDE